jgi:hypothetical protein
VRDALLNYPPGGALVGVVVLGPCQPNVSAPAATPSVAVQPSTQARVAPTPPTRTQAPEQSSSTTTTASAQQDVWTDVRAALPADVLVYQPTFMPERFGVPEVIEAAADRYIVVYTAPDENIAFILGYGAGAYTNDARPDTTEPFVVNGMEGQLASSFGGSPSFAVSWQNDEHSYQIKAYSQQITKAEMQQIVQSIAPVQ